MWPFSKSKIVNKTVVTLLPPILGTFQEHAKVLKKFLPNVTKDELAYAKKNWADGDIIRVLSPMEVNKKTSDIVDNLHDQGWNITMRSLDDPHCDCSNYYSSRCCNGINLGLHTDDNISVYDITFPDSLLSRGSFMEELTEDKVIPLTKAEAEHFHSQKVLTTRRAQIVEVC